MLWEKETKKSDAMYVDFFALKGEDAWNSTFAFISSSSENSERRKNELISIDIRKVGNDFFGRRDWAKATVMYNQSLRFSRLGSENISLAYANRSSCFFQEKSYGACLIDIKLAKEAGYPQHLIPKLDKRRADCLNAVKERSMKENLVERRMKLSFDAHEKYPCMTNVLKIKQDNNDDFSAFANEDIDVGKTIAAEKAFLTFVFQQYAMQCSICLKTNANLIPCEKCTEAMFCSQKCAKHFVHEYECGLRFANESEKNGRVMVVVRLNLLFLHKFSTADELMCFVEQNIKGNSVRQQQSDDLEMFCDYLKLPYNADLTYDESCIFTTFCAYKMLLQIPMVMRKFQSEKHRRFLMHLVFMTFAIFHDNSIYFKSVDEYLNIDMQKIISCHTGVTKRYFKHSCAPNVAWLSYDGHGVFITIRRVKKGDQLFVCSMLEILMEPREKRQRQLYRFKGFICKCSRCEGVVATPEQQWLLKSDTDYMRILSEQRVFVEHNARSDPMANYEAFLQKYGHIDWCEEIGHVVQIYVRLLFQNKFVDRH